MKKCFENPATIVAIDAGTVKQYWNESFSTFFNGEYCFSHYATLFFLLLTEYKLLVEDWRGYIIAEFALVWIANVYMGVFALIRQNIKKEKAEIALMEKKV